MAIDQHEPTRHHMSWALKRVAPGVSTRGGHCSIYSNSPDVQSTYEPKGTDRDGLHFASGHVSQVITCILLMLRL